MAAGFGRIGRFTIGAALCTRDVGLPGLSAACAGRRSLVLSGAKVAGSERPAFVRRDVSTHSLRAGLRPQAVPQGGMFLRCASCEALIINVVLPRRTGPGGRQLFRALCPLEEGAMKRTRYTDEQIAFALRQVESGTSVEEICRKMGVSEPTFYRWKKQFAGMGVAEIRRLKQLEEENAKLKRLVADLTLDKSMLQDVLRRKW